MDTTAVESIAKLAVAAERAHVLGTATPTIVLTDEDGKQTVASLEGYAAHRTRFRGRYSTASLVDFARYVIAHPGGHGFVRPKDLSAEVIFNLYVDADGSGAGHADHRAELKLGSSPAFCALNYANGGTAEQRHLVEWLEDWRDYLRADYPDTAPSDADPTHLAQAIAAVRKVKIKATTEAVHTDKNFGTSRSALEDVEASSDVGLPRGFMFTCRPSNDLDLRTFYLRLGVRTGADKPTFVLHWQQRDTDFEAIGQEFRAKLLDAVGDKATMLLGEFDAGV